MSAWPRVATLALAALGACSLTPPPEPPDPPELAVRSVLVLAILDETGHAPKTDLLATLPAPLREHGYGVVPVEAGLSWLADGGFAGTQALSPELAAWARERGIDALLALRVVHWDADWWNGLRRLDARIVYRLVATDERGLLWERDSTLGYEFDDWAGTWGFGGHGDSYGFGLGFGFGFGGYDRYPPLRTAIDVCRRVHRSVTSFMPKGALSHRR